MKNLVILLALSIATASFAEDAKQTGAAKNETETSAEVKPKVEMETPKSAEGQTQKPHLKNPNEKPVKEESLKELVDRMDKEKKQATITNQQYKTEVNAVIFKNRKDTKQCKTETKPKKGRMLVTWEISAEGKAQGFSKGEDTVENEKLYHCLIKKIESWKFGKPPYDRAMDIEHLFVF
jgi:hypothetical protein